ncbi:MAG: TIGR03986 family CRISPR-associated RAMP protein [Lachnospiraceae bacterium]|nr:TIGR03986 family CRISPR-associated RAMP protein [Lachnospiraceae bacterium]
MEKFLNPYNFISLPPKKESAYQYDDKKTLTGKIQYKVTTRSPLFIPNSSTDEAFRQSQKIEGHKSYDFFSYNELSPYSKTNCNPEPQCPVIPGSEIRGVIRSVYETLTDSCMGILNSETMPVKRSPERFEPGLLKKGERGYSLIKADSYRIGKPAKKGGCPPEFKENRNGARILFQKVGKDCITKYEIAQEGKNTFTDLTEKTGYLIKWGMGVKKKRYHLFVPIKDKARKEEIMVPTLSREEIEIKLLGVIESYLNQPMMKKDEQRENKKAYEEYQEDLMAFLRGEYGSDSYFPVTFSIMGNGKCYLAPAIYTKEISDNQIGKLAGEFNPCQGTEECPACAIFGHVDKSGIGSRGSRLRFSDLQVEKEKGPEDYYYPITTLPTLGEPKLGNVDFYLKRPENSPFWTYDYYYKYKKGGQDTILVEKPGELRGRKYYWHHPEYCLKKSARLPEDKPGPLNKTIRPLKDGVSFIGELYFEDISEKQLKQLVWILNSEKENIGYKLGAAKPFGFGSITCQVLGVTGRMISGEHGKILYEENPDLLEKYQDISYEEADFSKHCKSQFYRIARLDSVKEGMEIMYPKTLEQKQGGDNGKGFEWFSKNHTNINGNRMPNKRSQRKICVALPSLEDKEVGLPYDISGVCAKTVVKKTGVKKTGVKRCH